MTVINELVPYNCMSTLHGANCLNTVSSVFSSAKSEDVMVCLIRSFMLCAQLNIIRALKSCHMWIGGSCSTHGIERNFL